MESFSRGKWLVFGLVAIGIFMSTLDGSIVNVALPSIMKDIAAPLSTIEWVMLIYLLTVSSLLLSFGRLSDIRGRRWVYSRGLLVFSAGSVFCGISPDAACLIAARSFQGIGAAMIMACTPAIIIDIFPRSERGKALGMVGAVVASGLTLGPALGGWILHFYSWRAIFYINIPIGLIAAGIVNHLLKGSNADILREESFDRAGALLLIFCTVPFIFALTHGYKWGYYSPGILFLIALSAAAFSALAWVEHRVPYPIVSPYLLKIRLFMLPVLSALTLFMALFMMIFLMPFYLTYPRGFSPDQTGHMMVMPFIFLFLFAPISGSLSDRIGSRMLCTLGMGILAASLFLLSRLSPNLSSFNIAWRLALAGLGTAIFIAPNSSICMSSAPPNQKGFAAGTVATARNLGMVLGIAMAGTIFNSVFYKLSGGLNLRLYRPELEEVFMTAFHTAMLAGAIVAGVGVILAFMRGSENRINIIESENKTFQSDF